MTQRLASILTCVMARPGASPRTVFAKSRDGEILHISRVAAGAQGLECLGCGLELVAKPGHGGRVPHFAHKSAVECRHAGETDVHLMAKEAIEEAGGLMLPAFEVKTGGRTRMPLPPRWFDFERVELEKGEDGFRPDVIGYGRHPETGEVHRLMIEVFVTNRVSDSKLERIAAAGESAIEIDLSKVDRDLNGPGFIEQILQDAPRQWLFHRAEERLRQKALQEEAREAAKKERRKTFAIAMEAERQEERRRARERPPRATTDVERRWAARERDQWTLLDMGGLFSRPADDGLFDIEPIVWRAWVLSILAPWRKKAYPLPGADDLRKTVVSLGREMRRRGWVKTPFAGDLKTFQDNRYKPWDPVADEIEAFLVQGLRDYGFGGARLGDGVSLSSVGGVIKVSWRARQRWARDLLALRDELLWHGVDVWMGGARIERDAEVGDVIEAHGVFSGFNPTVLPDMAHEIRTGIARLGVRKEAGDYAREGVELHLPGDEGPGCTERALDHIRKAHMESWQRDLEDWTQGEVDRLLSVFQGLRDRGLLPLQEARAGSIEYLFDRSALWSRIHHPLSDEAKNPLAEARAAEKKTIQSLEVLADHVDYLGELVSLHDATEWRDIILREGIRTVLATAARDGFVRATGHGARSAARKSLSDLIRVSGRWGYGPDFPLRALGSRPTWSGRRLIDLVFDGDVRPLRRAMNEIITRRQPPKWVDAIEVS